LAQNYGLSSRDLSRIEHFVLERREEILDAWNRHFGS
jgi:hypothetical protein